MKRFLAILRRLTRYFFYLCLLVLLFISGLLWYITTDSFQQMVRGRLITAVEHATGGRAEVGTFHVIPLRFQVEVRDLTIHGRESPRDIPLAHVDSVSAVVNLSAVLGASIGFHSLTLQHPVVHIIFYPDGSTNIPTQKQQVTDFDKLFAFSIDRLEVRRGELLWQDEPVPIEFVSNDVSANLNHSFLRRRYAGTLSVGRAETQFDGYRPVSWAAQAAFSISKDAVQVQSLHATAGGTKLQATGNITNYLNPQLAGNYDLVLDLQQAGAVARQPQLRAGRLEVQGSGSWSHESFASSGKFDLTDAGWQDPTLATKNASASGKFSIDPKRLALSQVQGRVFRGSFTSEAEVVGWQAPEKPAKGAKPEPQRGKINARFKDVSLAEVLAAMGPRFSPVNRLKTVGDVSGTTDMRWRGSVQDSEIDAAINVNRPSRVAPGDIPLTASTRFSYSMRPLSVEISDLSANTPATQVRASGMLSKSSSLNVSFASSDLREWQPIASALFRQGLPVLIRGRAAFNGTATGSPQDPVFTGNLQLQDFDTAYTRPTSGKYHWDSLNADVQASSRSLNIRNSLLKSGDFTAKVDGAAGLIGWETTAQSPVHFRVDVENLDAGDLAAFTGRHEQLSGNINAKGEITGTVSKPNGQGSLSWSDGSVRGLAFDTANASVSVHGNQATFEHLQVARGGSRVTGDGTYDLAARTFQGNLAGKDFDLTEIAPLQSSRVQVGGRLDFTAQASGSEAKPLVTAHVHLRNLTLDGETAGDYLFDATTHGPDLHLTGHSDFPNAELSIDGDVRLRDLWPSQINFHFTRLDIDAFLASYLRGHLTGHSSVAGELSLQGPLRDPRRISVTGNFTSFNADIEKVKIRNEGPIHFSLANEMLRLESLHIVSDNTDFSAVGSMQVSGERKLDFSGTGKIGLQLVQTYDPDLSGSGSIQGDARITGTFGAPVVRGKVQIVDGGLSDANLPSALSGLSGTFVFSQNQVTIESLTGRTGGGTIGFTGHAELVGRQVNFDLNATADAVRLRYPPGVSSTANANLRWNGSSNGSLLSGEITVIKLGVTPGFDFGAYLERSIQAASLPQTDPVLNRIRLDLHVVTAPELQMQTSVLRLRGEADLRVRGSAAKPVLLGRADIFEGEAYFSGTKYRLERGGVTFSNPAVTTPFLDLEATTRVRDYDVTLSITGPADRPKLNYRSEPPLATNDIIALLAFGQTTEESAQLQQSSQSAFSQQASNAMLAAALNATLNNRAQRLFGNSRIKIDPQGLETETSPTQSGPAVTIEQQVKDNLTLTYTTNVAQTSQQIIRAEYNVTRNVSIVAIRDQNGVVSFDVKIRRRKR